jgi:hypothetical protein
VEFKDISGGLEVLMAVMILILLLSCNAVWTWPEDEGSMFLWNASFHMQVHMVPQPKRITLTHK